MERKITRRFEEWRANPSRKPMILTGCRQIGKTYSVLEFAEREYRSFVYINFEVDPDKRMLFDGSLDPGSLVPRITLSERTRLYPGESLIVLDEIQNCPNAYSALKPLFYDGRFDVIGLGSFLGVNLDDEDSRISPLGHVEVIRMHPMDFEEYLWAMGIKRELVDEVARCIRSREEVPEYFNRILTEHFRRYMVVGGMPEAVGIYARTSDYSRAAKALDDIITLLMKDAGRYSRKAGREKINACFRSIPRQLSREDKRFHYSDVEKRKNSGRRMYGNSLAWLEEAGLTIRCNNLTEPVMPLSERESEDSFKIYMADTGILMRLMPDTDPALVVLNDPNVNHGALMENAVASALSKKGYTPCFYSRRDSTLEIDFVIGYGGRVALMEVKSGRNRRAKSLRTLMSERAANRDGYKIMDTNVEVDTDGIVHLPIYAASLLEDHVVGGIPDVGTDADTVNRMFDEYMAGKAP
ncbi:MAG: ATP-binding protein [Candidatus Methanomethylophilaceae archaeon]|nr:ATP-binding protein [Candidatus Methanomethylophilaceae archaeon]